MKAILVLALLSVNAQAQEALRDPTRAPAALARAEDPAAAAAEPVVLSTVPMLQSVLIAQGTKGRRVAVIDGHAVRVGDKVRDAVVEAIHPTEVVLKEGKTRNVLKFQTAEPATDSAGISAGVKANDKK